MIEDIEFLKNLLEKSELFNGKIEGTQALKDHFSEEYLNKIITKASTNIKKNVVFAAFKDGQPFTDVDLDKEVAKMTCENVLSVLKQLPCSVRVTNVQQIDDDLKKLCLYLYKETDYAVTVNMYITPGAGQNCFLYHPDDQETLVYQLYGRKNWSIPLDENKKEIYSYIPFTENDSIKSELSYILNSGEMTYLPNCLVHKAEAFPEELSIHFTFAFTNFSKAAFRVFIGDEIDKAIDFGKSRFKQADTESMSIWIDKIKEHLSAMNTKETVSTIEKKFKREEMQILKFGRHYDEKSGANDGSD